jgi:hypothetical protein
MQVISLSLKSLQRKQLTEMRSRVSALESEALASTHKLSLAYAHTESQVASARNEAESR